MKAARIVNVNEPLQIQELQTPKPKGSQILIKVQSVGVCHSDVHVWEGYYEGIGGQPLKTTDRGVKYPLTPGNCGFGRELSRYGMLEFVNIKSVRFYDQLIYDHHVE